ncbi:MAG: anhydro-N-acetylmuramic acid kinase [Rhodothermales bacterium]
MNGLIDLLKKPTRVIIGVMSGTSLDGVDVALTRVSGSGATVDIDLLAFHSEAYPSDLRSLLLQNAAVETSNVRDLSQLNIRLAHTYAAAVHSLLAEADCPLEEVDAIGCHGQTVFHVPDATTCAGIDVTSTLQIGDPSTLANLLGVPVVGQFRQADMALGGQGAPLVPYFDYVFLRDAHETRGLLNLGGIANLTIIPAGAGLNEVAAFDTGPANMVMDALAQRLYGQPRDEGGRIAAQGTVHQPLLDVLLADPYYALPPPKSTGREKYTEGFIDELLHRAVVLTPPDILATATALTAETIARAYTEFFAETTPLDRLVAAGGGVHNATLMRMLAERFAPIPVQTLHDLGLDPDAKEAICFAVLAHETLNGAPSNVPSATGATRTAVLGVIALPS